MSDSKFRTSVQIPEFRWKASYQKSSLFMGSCFTENVGKKMENLKFPADINPFGILYNPVSVANGLRLLIQPKTFAESDLIEHNGVWHSFLHHGRFSSTDANQTLQNINKRLVNSSEFLKKTDFLFITFGTAWVYRFNKTKKIVSNCHKIPAAFFTRERLTVDEIVALYQDLLAELWQLNPEIKIIFTVSPIRHWKDGAIENQRSKSILLLAIDSLVKKHENYCAYFPSYEIVMDELRDYRFYAADMIHLSEVAIDHIWERFANCLIDEESRKIVVEVRKIVNAMQHRPLNTTTPEFRKFIENTLENLNNTGMKYPYLNLKLEKEYFVRHLDDLTN